MSLTTEQNIEYKNYILCSSCHQHGLNIFYTNINKKFICECRICGKQYDIKSSKDPQRGSCEYNVITITDKDKEHETNNRTM